MKLHELLETKNPGEQAKKVKQLKDMAGAPVIDLVIRYDGRAGRIHIAGIIGGQLTPVQARQMLDGAREELRRLELEAAAGQNGDGKDDNIS